MTAFICMCLQREWWKDLYLMIAQLWPFSMRVSVVSSNSLKWGVPYEKLLGQVIWMAFRVPTYSSNEVEENVINIVIILHNWFNGAVNILLQQKEQRHSQNFSLSQARTLKAAAKVTKRVRTQYVPQPHQLEQRLSDRSPAWDIPDWRLHIDILNI